MSFVQVFVKTEECARNAPVSTSELARLHCSQTLITCSQTGQKDKRTERQKHIGIGEIAPFSDSHHLFIEWTERQKDKETIGKKDNRTERQKDRNVCFCCNGTGNLLLHPGSDKTADTVHYCILGTFSDSVHSFKGSCLLYNCISLKSTELQINQLQLSVTGLLVTTFTNLFKLANLFDKIAKSICLHYEMFFATQS